MIRTAAWSVLVGLHLVACGSGSSGNDKPAPVPPEEIPDPNSGLIDETLPADVDLQTHMVFDNRLSEAIRNDLRRDFTRIERFDLTTGTENDEELKSLLGLKDLQGPSMSRWLMERVRYLLSPDLTQYRMGVVIAKTQTFELFEEDEPTDSPEDSANVAAIMIGAALYKFSKEIRVSHPEVNYVAIEVNGNWIHANNQRNGVMQIGPALFNPEYQPNNENSTSYANTAVRVETLYHEARHADGNTVSGSLGFVHALCPDTTAFTEEIRKKPACDSNANGPYTVGARVLRAYIKKCGNLCSLKDKTILQSFLIDSESRVITRSNGERPILDPKPERGFEKIDISSFALIPASRD